MLSKDGAIRKDFMFSFLLITEKNYTKTKILKQSYGRRPVVAIDMSGIAGSLTDWGSYCNEE